MKVDPLREIARQLELIALTLQIGNETVIDLAHRIEAVETGLEELRAELHGGRHAVKETAADPGII